MGNQYIERRRENPAGNRERLLPREGIGALSVRTPDGWDGEVVWERGEWPQIEADGDVEVTLEAIEGWIFVGPEKLSGTVEDVNRALRNIAGGSTDDRPLVLQMTVGVDDMGEFAEALAALQAALAAREDAD